MAQIQHPQQGQIVKVRNRHYVVADVLESSVTKHASDAKAQGELQHLVTLNSIEDDALGEELQVIWELEVGASVQNPKSLPVPDRFDQPEQLRTFLNAVRWGAVSNADIQSLQAPFRSGIAIEDYQLDPVVRALNMPRVNLLIADDVGLGKTIEAGLVIQELLLRQRARRVLIVCPAALQIQWRDQMRDKFGLDFRIVDSELMHNLRRQRGLHVNPWTHFPRLITSIDYIKRDQPLRLFRESLPAGGEAIYPRSYDLLIVDEAHNVAPPHVNKYSVDSQRTLAIRTLAPHFEHKLFLSATPHNGYPSSFSALLELLDNQRFARDLDPKPEMLRSVMVRRLKSEIVDTWSGRKRFPERKLYALEVDYSPEERQAHKLLQLYTDSRRQNATDSNEHTATEFVLKLLKKRLFSSPAAFSRTLEKHRDTLQNAKRSAPSHKPKPSILRSMIDELDESYANEESFEQETEEMLSTTSAFFRQPTPQEQQWLEQLHTWANDAKYRPDSKATALIDWLKTIVKPNNQWSDERVIIFTEYRDTQRWLQELLVSHCLGDADRLMLLSGNLNDEERERIKAAFQARPSESNVRILIATDAASEGIDLQRYCHRLLHFEIPWNPNRLEQRNGRIDRHGQEHNPEIYHFVPKGYREDLSDAQSRAVGDLEGDLEFLARAVRKVDQIRQDLGKVGPVIAQQIGEAMSGTRRRLDTTQAEREAEPSKRLLKFEQDLDKRIRQLHDQLDTSRVALQISPENIYAAVSLALQLANQPALIETKLEGIWPDPTGQRKSCPVFEVPNLNRGWERCTEGLTHILTGKRRPIVFDHDLARNRDDVVLVHLNHPLVQTALRLLRAEIWSSDERRKLSRVAAQVIPNVIDVAGSPQAIRVPLVIAYARLVLIGGDSQRLHEELLMAGVTLEGKAARELSEAEISAALKAATHRQPSDESKAILQERWPEVEKLLKQALSKQESKRRSNLRTKLDGRSRKEREHIRSILSELQTRIQNVLKQSEQPQQLEFDFFNKEEQQQYQRNMEALRQRSARIPDEIEQECANIAQRYADPQARLFPLALLFLVPQNLA